MPEFRNNTSTTGNCINGIFPQYGCNISSNPDSAMSQCNLSKKPMENDNTTQNWNSVMDNYGSVSTTFKPKAPMPSNKHMSRFQPYQASLRKIPNKCNQTGNPSTTTIISEKETAIEKIHMTDSSPTCNKALNIKSEPGIYHMNISNNQITDMMNKTKEMTIKQENIEQDICNLKINLAEKITKISTMNMCNEESASEISKDKATREETSKDISYVTTTKDISNEEFSNKKTDTSNNQRNEKTSYTFNVKKACDNLDTSESIVTKSCSNSLTYKSCSDNSKESSSPSPSQHTLLVDNKQCLNSNSCTLDTHCSQCELVIAKAKLTINEWFVTNKFYPSPGQMATLVRNTGIRAMCLHQLFQKHLKTNISK
jgi:hypothetical protein